MERQFRTRYIYPIAILFLVLFVFFSASLLIIETKIIYQFFVGKSNIEDIGVFFGILFLLGYFSMMSGHMTLLLRYGLIIGNGRIILVNHLFFVQTDITNLVEGYSRSDFGKYSKSKKSLILYLTDGRKINLPRFLYLNFQKIEDSLIENKVRFLGEEQFEWKNLIQRKYEY